MMPAHRVDPARRMPFARFHCPYCGESLETFVDVETGAADYIEDCQVCCRPIEIHAGVDADGDAWIAARTGDDA